MDGADAADANFLPVTARASASPEACAYCGQSDAPPNKVGMPESTVRLHRDCEEYWLREQAPITEGSSARIKECL
jgi:hypothetical protein